MLHTLLQKLVERKLVTVKEVQDATGRGSSTVYRWLRGETEPDFDDLRLLLKHMANRDAQRSLLSLFTKDLPVAVEWLPDEPPVPPDRPGQGPAAPPQDPLELALLAMDSLTELMHAEKHLAEADTISDNDYEQTAEIIDRTISYLHRSKHALRQKIVHRRKARTSQG